MTTAPLWKAFVRVPAAETAEVASLFELIPFPSPVAVLIEGLPEDRIHTVEALYADAPDAAELSTILSRDVHVEPLPDQDWIKHSYEGLPPVRAGRFFVYGAHDKGKVPPSVIPLRIEAGLAFGTGHHETTAGCLQAIWDLTRTKRFANPLDLGCGTGVLGIGIAKLLHVPVMASDIDAQATRVARENARQNGVGPLLQVVAANGFGNASLTRRAPYDLVVANILAGPLTRLAPAIGRNTVTGGTVILSGLLRTQEQLVLSFYRSLGFRLARRYRLGPWSTLVLAG